MSSELREIKKQIRREKIIFIAIFVALLFPVISKNKDLGITKYESFIYNITVRDYIAPDCTRYQGKEIKIFGQIIYSDLDFSELDREQEKIKQEKINF